jgi:DNA-binding response OmpR family regulator
MPEHAKATIMNASANPTASTQAESLKKLHSAVAQCGFDVELFDPTCDMDFLSVIRAAKFSVLVSSDYQEICSAARYFDQDGAKTSAVIYLTQYDEVAELLGLRLGAYDVVHDNMSARVICERITAARNFHKKIAQISVSHDDKNDEAAVPDVLFDLRNQQFRFRGEIIALTRVETKIIELLWQNRECLVSRDELAEAVFPHKTTIKERIIDSHIKRIRYKFADAGISKHLITSVYGGGYKMICQDDLERR